MGTDGILVLAKRRGLIVSLAEALEAIKGAGLWLGEPLVDLLLEQVNEK